MASKDYPFIEIAVMPAVRARFSAGEGLLVLSPAADHVYWANGAACRQFGYPTIYALFDDDEFAESVTARQIATAAAQLSPARERAPVLLRLGSGFRRTATQCVVERFSLPDGKPAVLLALPQAAPARDSIARASAIIGGLADAATHVAALDGEGNLLAHSDLFTALAIDHDDLEAMIADVDRDQTRLVRREVPTRLGRMPAAVARIADQPACHLLFVVEPEAEQSERQTQRRQPADASAIAPAAPDALVATKVQPEAVRSARDKKTADQRTGAKEPAFRFDPDAKPVRFVWRIGPDGRFSDISSEFGKIVGPNAADVIGRTFDEVAKVFNLDPHHVIADLLARHDTWSGKTVFWPVQGTALEVPVDLAALPTYTRERGFDGFRGFGIVRTGDIQDDQERLGLALDPATAAAANPQPLITTEPADSPAKALPPASNDDAQKAEREPALGAPSPDRSTTDRPLHGPLNVPALHIVKTPGRRHSDKVISLEQHRRTGRDGLSRSDHAVFQQIGEELGKRLGTPNSERMSSNGRGPRPVDIDDLTTSRPVPDAEPVRANALLRQRPSKTRVPAAAEHVAAVSLQRRIASPHPVSGSGGRARVSPAFLDALPLAVIIHRGDQILHVNAELLEMIGYADLAALQAAGGLSALFAGRSAIEEARDTLVLTTADGHRLSVRARLKSVDWNGGTALMLALAPAIAKGHGGDPAATQLEMLELRSILDTATDGVILLAHDGTIRSMNGAASALFDYDIAEVAGQPFAMLFAHESQRDVLDYVASLGNNGVASVLNDGREAIAQEASGGLIPIFMTIGTVSASRGYCAVIRDITHFKRTEEELREAKRAAETANRHKSDFLARMSHEIRTPLNAIIGFSEMMATERFGPIGSPRYLEYAQDIGRSGRHVLDIVNDLLDISKIEAGGQELDFKAVSLNETLGECVSLLQPQANAQRVIIRTSLSASLPPVVADQRSIRQIAINLLANAIRFTPPGGQIVVSTALDLAGRAIMRVRDTGIGMSRSELELAMKPFHQTTASLDRPRGDGTGLGLPLTKAMAEANRAQFSIESTPGDGTLVEIVFPPQRVLAT